MAEFTEMLGMQMARCEDGVCETTLVLDERHMSVAERVHGGVLFTLLDTAMGRAIISRLPEGRGCATIEARINCFRPVQHGSLRAEARVVTITRRTAYAEASLFDGEERLVARASGTFFLTESRRQADRERV